MGVQFGAVRIRADVGDGQGPGQRQRAQVAHDRASGDGVGTGTRPGHQSDQRVSASILGAARSFRDAAQLTSAARIQQFQAQMDQVHAEGVTERASYATTIAWGNEPYTGGDYAVYKSGQHLRFWTALRRGTPRIRFAGEHTEVIAGYMESAVRSGHRVAKELGAP